MMVKSDQHARSSHENAPDIVSILQNMQVLEVTVVSVLWTYNLVPDLSTCTEGGSDAGAIGPVSNPSSPLKCLSKS